jgi:RNA polymerase sigma-70 factor (ECF subfamily)
MTFEEDLKLARRVSSGDEAAFRQFFDEYYDRVYRFALGRVGDSHHVTEDIVQISFTKALDKMATYRGEAKLFTWICTICRNQITDWQRKHGQANSRVVLLEDLPEVQVILDSFHAPECDDPLIMSQRDEAVRLIQVVLDQLPARYGNVLEWKFVEGYSAKEIAGRLEMSLDATNSLTARAKRAFGELYIPLVQAADARQAKA